MTTSKINNDDDVNNHKGQWQKILSAINDALLGAKEKQLKDKLLQTIEQNPSIFIAKRTKILNPPTGFLGWFIRLFTFVLKNTSPLYISLENTVYVPPTSQGNTAETELPIQTSTADLSPPLKTAQSPAKQLDNLFEQYNPEISGFMEDSILSEDAFIQLHTMTQILMEECVCASNTPEYHIQRIQYLLILMNANLFPQFIALIKQNPEKKLNTILDTLYADKLPAITKATKDLMKHKAHTAFEDFEYRQEIAEKTEHNYLDSPNEILTEQLNSGQVKKTPLSFYFARLATEQLLMDYYACSEHKRHHKLEKRNQTLHQTIQNLSKHILLTWNDNTYSSSSELLGLGPNAPIPTTFASLEQDWIAPLLIDIQRGGIEQAITTILDKSAMGNSLSEQQIDWIVSRLSYYFPNNEEIKRIQETLLLEKNRISPLITLLDEITVMESTKTGKELKLAPLQKKLSQELNRLEQDNKKIKAHIIKQVERGCKWTTNTTCLTDIAQTQKTPAANITPLRTFSVFCPIEPHATKKASHELTDAITPQSFEKPTCEISLCRIAPFKG